MPVVSMFGQPPLWILGLARVVGGLGDQFGKFCIVVDTMYHHGQFMFEHLRSLKSCVAIDIAIVCGNMNESVLVDEREICRERAIYQWQIILWCLRGLAALVIYSTVFGDIDRVLHTDRYILHGTATSSMIEYIRVLLNQDSEFLLSGLEDTRM